MGNGFGELVLINLGWGGRFSGRGNAWSDHGEPDLIGTRYVLAMIRPFVFINVAASMVGGDQQCGFIFIRGVALDIGPDIADPFINLACSIQVKAVSPGMSPLVCFAIGDVYDLWLVSPDVFHCAMMGKYIQAFMVMP